MVDRTFAGLRDWLGGASTDQRDADRAELDQAPQADAREIEFSGYTEDCRIFGFTQLGAERLSDALNEADQLRLDSVLLVALEDNRALELSELTVGRDELVAVRASGPRGNAARRVRTRPSPVAVKAGPYLIRGYVHGPPGGDPLRRFRTQRPMVPLTEAWIEYTAGVAQHRARVGPLIVNTVFVDWVDRAKETDVRVDLPVEMRIDPRAKDMTGNVRLTGQAGGRSPRRRT
jgi:hypothetical protein